MPNISRYPSQQYNIMYFEKTKYRSIDEIKSKKS